jgi:hypothetical protein
MNENVLNTDENSSQNNTLIENPMSVESSNSGIDQLTLELFMNKNMYKKYISKTDPKKHAELQAHLSNIQYYKQQIVDITIELLEDPTIQITNEVDDIFKIYVKTMINHLQQRERENQNEYNNENDKDNIMFGNVVDFSQAQSLEQPKMHSFWGKNKVVKRY